MARSSISRINRRLARVEAAVGGVHRARPSVTDIWLYKLEETVTQIVKYAWRKTEPKPDNEGDYDRFFLYAHRDRLRTAEDVRNAPDDVLLEALGLRDPAWWGWMYFMVRELGFASLLIHNWGWPCAGGPYDVSVEEANLDERRAQVALHFIDLMRERGHDAKSFAANYFADIVAEASVITGREPDEVADVCLEAVKKADEFAYYVLVCDQIAVRPRARYPPGPVLYSGDHRAQVFSEVKRAADNRRRLWRGSRILPAGQGS